MTTENIPPARPDASGIRTSTDVYENPTERELSEACDIVHYAKMYVDGGSRGEFDTRFLGRPRLGAIVAANHALRREGWRIAQGQGASGLADHPVTTWYVLEPVPALLSVDIRIDNVPMDWGAAPEPEPDGAVVQSVIDRVAKAVRAHHPELDLSGVSMTRRVLDAVNEALRPTPWCVRVCRENDADAESPQTYVVTEKYGTRNHG